MLIPKWALRISLKLRSSRLTSFSTVLSKRVLKSMQSPCLGSGSLSLFQPAHVWSARNSDGAHLWGAGEEGPLFALCCANCTLRLCFQDDLIREDFIIPKSHFKEKQPRLQTERLQALTLSCNNHVPLIIIPTVSGLPCEPHYFHL